MSNSSRIRARWTGLVSPVSRRPVFRIEDDAGRVLRRIGTARHAAEAVAHDWRTAGCDAKLAPAMAEPPSDARLRRRIEVAQSRDRNGLRADMQTHELPLPDPGEQPAPTPRPAPRQRRARNAGHTGPDLFDRAAPDAIAAATKPQPLPIPLPVAEPDPPREPDASYNPHHLDPQAMLLRQVDPRNLRPTDRNDPYLYHVTHGAEAATALEDGLMVSAQDPIILTERQGVQYWLSVVAEDFDVILDGPANLAVLRLRRIAVEPLLEPDAEASRSAGCACYLLTGGPGARR